MKGARRGWRASQGFRPGIRSHIPKGGTPFISYKGVGLRLEGIPKESVKRTGFLRKVRRRVLARVTGSSQGRNKSRYL
jgi:hypothetical protein